MTVVGNDPERQVMERDWQIAAARRLKNAVAAMLRR